MFVRAWPTSLDIGEDAPQEGARRSDHRSGSASRPPLVLDQGTAGARVVGGDRGTLGCCAAGQLQRERSVSPCYSGGVRAGDAASTRDFIHGASPVRVATGVQSVGGDIRPISAHAQHCPRAAVGH
eukprot:7518720-Pyramimonas_sp.AAC.1